MLFSKMLVDPRGFEPLASAACPGTKNGVDRTGIEPVASAVQMRRSTK